MIIFVNLPLVLRKLLSVGVWVAGGRAATFLVGVRYLFNLFYFCKKVGGGGRES